MCGSSGPSKGDLAREREAARKEAEAERVKAAVDSGDVELMACWANWLAGIAKGIRNASARVRAIAERTV